MNRYCLALPYSSLATELPHGFALDQTELLPQYILEVLPPVTYPRMLRPSKLPQLTCISAAPGRSSVASNRSPAFRTSSAPPAPPTRTR